MHRFRSPQHNLLFAAPGLATALPSPITPASTVAAPSTPRNPSIASGEVEVEPKETDPSKNKEKDNKEKNKRPKVTKLIPVTPLERGRDLEKNILAKKSECSNLTTQIKTLDFGHGLASELTKFGETFESLDCSYIFFSDLADLALDPVLAVASLVLCFVVSSSCKRNCLVCDLPVIKESLHVCPKADSC